MDVAYLQETVGEPVARGLAEVIAQQPIDPVEYLGLYLKHEDDLALREEKLASLVQTFQIQQDEFQQNFRAELSTLIEQQREEEAARLQAIQERQALVKSLMEEYQQNRDSFLAELEDREFEIEDEGKGENVLAAEGERRRAEELFSFTSSFLDRILDRVLLISVKSLPEVSSGLCRTIRAVFYLVSNCSRLQVDSWRKLQRMIVRTKDLVDRIKSYRPLQDRRQQKFRRISTILQCTSSDSIREENFVAFLLHDWVSACYRLREAQVAEVAAQKAAGLEISDDIFDEEEEPDSDPPESGDESSNPPDSTVEDEDEDEDE